MSGEIIVSRNQEKRKKDALENARQPKKQKHTGFRTAELLKKTVQHEQYVTNRS